MENTQTSVWCLYVCLYDWLFVYLFVRLSAKTVEYKLNYEHARWAMNILLFHNFLRLSAREKKRAID